MHHQLKCRLSAYPTKMARKCEMLEWPFGGLRNPSFDLETVLLDHQLDNSLSWVRTSCPFLLAFVLTLDLLRQIL